MSRSSSASPVYGRKRNQPSTVEPAFLSVEECAAPEVLREDVESIFTAFDARRVPRVWLFFVGLALSAIAAFFLFQSAAEKDWTFVVLFAGGALSYAPIGMLKNEFKDQLIPQILTQYGFTYDRKASRVRLKDYTDVLPSYTSSSLSDHFWGTRDGIKVGVCELTLSQKSGKNSRTVFDGLLCRFDYPKTAKTEVAVKSDAGAVGQFFRDVFASADRVKLEDPAFEARFDVYSCDQVAARYILTPTVMERLMILERHHRGLRAIFRGSEVLLAIPDGTDLFHPGSFFSELDRGLVRQFHQDMTSILAFIEVLKLDAQSKI